MKRLICCLVLLCLLLSSCAGQTQPEQKKYTATFLTMFDTVTAIVGYADSEEEFQRITKPIHDELLIYHQLFDIYNDYDGVNNLKTVNDNAGIQPVLVDRKIIDLLLDCRQYYETTNGCVNVAMGSVLKLWHVARNEGINDPANARLPKMDDLRNAAQYMDFSALIIDETASSVYITDRNVSLDVGAIAKGWSLQRVVASAPNNLLISVGGNVCATGARDAQGTPWVVGVQDPNGGDNYLHTLYVSGGSVVTSGDYQRAYIVDGEIYHHIIDPDTLFPSTLWRSVTIVCNDSGLADALSTALFLLPREEGQKLLDNFEARAMWVDREGNIFYSPGFETMIRT